ncbi:hypothetical protein A2631_05490 [Candidatus Daviesbacteria bacterium RIFCSPHIGHO2_01_FULL_44_29]|uniref:HD/PDEase domain-containing protein n=1 Tax=Candidatus Daviesbacteria bacterium RIFCSPHIGHO2_02_FULL_43_12 TaxID=1797776 RepID=A0A1F5KI18_9BACT|nr:MAG: hypothetical protein A2631_05490 [Candidatus Daviesbacteria bacterium RIFCSPHIGHO2_01_FULL_44_29]OGE39201.1 MAG: hypothetical protein A3E86_01235 [Candidatus Daviesbacteria bacterium RIFCSPHIGHO2_12_FULL_47_45]OGE40597.1 MAG: hypothetical protein A3D25_00575 [Candidatus Daviesbacteria bacterium RIFCSPHIGHO2_02_FULL_43_12]OGE70157.1 MAG: hypothetical protein A3B55_00345 [Candidatus Daviesbacteria bacterium RIFCSPLOWO2_01_FULL_43_15]
MTESLRRNSGPKTDADVRRHIADGLKPWGKVGVTTLDDSVARLNADPVKYGPTLSQIDQFRARTRGAREFEIMSDRKGAYGRLIRQDRLLGPYGALALMLELHMDQKDRPDGTPYISHPLDVAIRVSDHLEKPNGDLLVAALMHDSVEDQAVKLVKMAPVGLYWGGLTDTQIALSVVGAKYGTRVRRIVSALSNEDTDAIAIAEGINPKDKVAFTNRKNELYAEHVGAAIQDPDVVLIKMFDFSANALRLDEVKDPERKLKLLAKYTPVVPRFIDRLNDTSRPVKVRGRDKILQELSEAHEKMTAQLEESK